MASPRNRPRRHLKILSGLILFCALLALVLAAAYLRASLPRLDGDVGAGGGRRGAGAARPRPGAAARRPTTTQRDTPR